MGEACFPAQTAGLVLLSTPNFLVLLDALVPLVLLSRLSTASIVAVFSRSEESKVRVCSDKVISRAVPAAPACLLVSGIFSNRGLCRLPQCTDFQMGFICNILAQLLRFSLFPFTAKERVPASGWHWLREGVQTSLGHVTLLAQCGASPVASRPYHILIVAVF